MTTDDAITKVQEAGYCLHNLFQLGDRRWRANIRDGAGTFFFDFGEGETPGAAILAALSRAPDKPLGVVARKVSVPASSTETGGVLD